MGIYNSAGAATFYNTILWDHPNGDFSGSITFSNCCATGLSAGVQGNIVDNPLFTNTTISAFTLENNSPCVNTGLKLFWMLTALDLAGNPRINQILVDMGAYEAQLPARAFTLIVR